MKSAIIFISVHHQNTQKIATAISEGLAADLLQLSSVTSNKLEQYDLIGLGSGIFFGKHHEKLFELINGVNIKDKNVFVFSTSGTGSAKNNSALINALASKGVKVEKSFSCKGYDTYGIFKYVGGISKGRPNKDDIEKAREFACSLISNI
ncbi:MAG: flavodoxin family protein [Ruminiclostridium sp.]|nr:flavodoxin family protein [Ruminiclostridium sp.]